MTKHPLQTNDEKMDRLVELLEHINRRDRLRMIGGFFRSLLAIIPMLLTLYAVWYLYNHGDEFMESVARQAAEQAARVATQNGQNISADSQELFEQIQQMMRRGN